MKKSKTMIVLFLIPAIITYVLVFLYPTLRTFFMSFFNIEGVTDPVSKWTFTGLDNYKYLFRTQVFIQSLRNVGRIWLYGGISVMLLALTFAVILTSGIRFKSFYRAAIYLPNVVSAIAMGTMWVQYVYSPRYGLFMNMFKTLGLKGLASTQWTSPGMIFYGMLVAYCFGMVGYHMLIFMSGIERIPVDYYEAATIDGANVFRRFFSITLPLLKGVIRTNIVLWSVSTVAFFIWSQIFSPLTPDPGTITPMVYMYQSIFGAQIAVTTRNAGVGAAVGVMLAIIVVVVFSATTFITRNDDIEI